MKFTGILIGSENPKQLVDYYTKIFGKAGMDDGGYVGWQFGDGWITVGPHDQVKGKNATPGRIIWNIETPDVKGQFEKFRAAGATVVREPYSMEGGAPGQEAAEFFIATFADPDGNYFQLMSPMEMPSESASEKENATASR
jgi:predicted enzyme related to lactoylglutathione lyase